MSEIASFTSLYPVIGIPSLFILIYFIAKKAMADLKSKNDEDRAEHLKKWNSMIDTNKTIQDNALKIFREQNTKLIESHEKALERVFKLQERTTAALEMQTANMAKMNEKLNNINQIVGLTLCGQPSLNKGKTK